MATNNAINSPQITAGGPITFSGAFSFTATLTANTNVTFPVSGTLATVGGTLLPWTDVTGTSQAAAVNNGYIADNAALCTITLPATAALGSIVAVQGKGAGGWKIAQNAGQSINFGTSTTTAGTGGSLASTNQWDSLELLCVTANTGWAVLGGAQGNITVV